MYAEKVVIITHSSSGLGKQTVKLFVRRGISKICLIFEKNYGTEKKLRLAENETA